MKNRILAYIVIIATVFQMFSWISHDFKSMNVMADENELSQPKMVDGTYQISSAKELMWAKENPGKDYILTSDIDLSGYENFQGIGTETEPYSGEFNGNGHSIKIGINRTDSTEEIEKIGLFNYVSGEIHNLVVTGSINVSVAGGYVGGISAVLLGGYIYDCTTDVAINATGTKEALNVGGIAGGVKNEQKESTIENSVNNGEINVNAMSAQRGENDYNNGTSGAVGGIVGLVVAKSGVKVARTINNGEIIVNGGKDNIGGIVGQTSVNENSTYVDISYCANKGNIEVYKTEGERAAGIIGYVKSGKIRYCYNVGNVVEYTDNGNTLARNGYGNYFGIFGYANLSSDNKLSVLYCYNASEKKLEAEICVVRNPSNGEFKNFYMSGRSEYETELNSNATAGTAGEPFQNSTELYNKITAYTEGASAYRKNSQGGYPVLYFEKNAVYESNPIDNDTVDVKLENMPKYIDGVVSDNIYNCGPGMASDENGTTSEDAKMVVIKDTSRSTFEDYVDKLVCRGYGKTSKREMENNMYYTLTKAGRIYYIYYTYSKNEVRVICDYASNTLLSNISTKLTGDSETEMYMYSIDYTKGESTTSVTDYWQIDCGMMFIIKLADNSLFLIDSGHERQSSKEAMAAELNFMRKITNTSENDKVKIRGWFFSHAHGDHVFGAHQFVTMYHDYIDVESVLFNFPAYGVVGGYDGGTFKMKKAFNTYFPNVNHVSLHTGQRFSMQGVNFDVMCTHEDWVSTDGKTTLGGDMNTASTVLKITINGKSLMLLGDITKSDQLEKMYGNELKSDMVQVAHHGYNRLTSLYKAIGAKYAICPNSEENAGLNSGNKQKLQDILDAGATKAIFAGEYTYKITTDNGIQMSTYDNYRKELGIDFDAPGGNLSEVNGKNAVIGSDSDIEKGKKLRDELITVSVNGSPVSSKNAGNAIRTENAYMAFDGSTSTKYCTETIPANIKWKTTKPVSIDEYVLYTANDTQNNPGRNPVKWILKGSNDGKNWNIIDAVSDGNLPAKNYTGTIFKSKNPGKYCYFAICFLEINSGNILQLSEIELIENQQQNISDKVNVQGFQISSVLKGIRTVSTVEPQIDGMEVTEFGNVYGVDENGVSEDDMYVGSESKYISTVKATENGIINKQYSSSETAVNYVMTMCDNGTTVAAYTRKYYVRAYAKLSDGSYLYSKVYSYSIYDVAKKLYDNALMSTYAGHRYLYEDILTVVDSNYKEVKYNWGGTIAR